MSELNDICLFWDERLSKKENTKIEKYIQTGAVKNQLIIKEYSDFLTQFGDILFAHLEINCGLYHATDPRRIFWVREMQDEVNLLLRATYPDIDLPVYEYEDLEWDEDPHEMAAWDQQIVHFFPYNEFCFGEKSPILHILVRVNPIAFLKVKDGLLEILSSLDDPTGRGFCTMQAERITTESAIIGKMKMDGKDRFFRQLVSYF